MVRFHTLPRCLVMPVMLYNDAASTEGEPVSSMYCVSTWYVGQ